MGARRVPSAGRHGGQAEGRSGGQRRHRRLQGVRAAAPADRVRARRTGRARPPPRCTSSAPPPGPRSPATRSPPRSGTTSTRCRTSASASTPTWSSSPRPPPTCSPRPPTASPTTCSPTRCSPPAARWSSPPPCTPRCGSTRPPRRTSPRCAAAAPSSSSPPWAGSPASTPARAGCPTPPRSSRSAAGCWPAACAEPDLAGRHVVVSAGGTREPLDPVRFLGNRSSGKQGYALARTAAARGARVTLIAANTGLPDPAGVDVVRVGTAVQLREAVLKAAAGRRRRGDGRGRGRLPARRRTPTGKIKKKDGAGARAASPWSAIRTSSPRSPPSGPGPGRSSSASPPRPTTSSPTAAPSSRRKGCDLLVVNEVGERKTFGSEENEAVVLAADGSETPVPYGPEGSPGRHGLGPGRATRLA